MLQKLNERIQGIVAWVIISLIAVTFALFGIDYYVQSRHASSVVVEVNNQPISKREFELSYKRIRQTQDPALFTSERDAKLKKQILDDFIINKVSVQSARAYGFEVTSEQANSAIVNIPQFQEDGHFSAERFQQAITGAFFTPESFQKEVRQGMLLNQQRFAFIGTSFALSNEIKRFIKLYMQTRDYDYLTTLTQQFINKNSVTDKEVEQYYKSHTKAFLSPEKVAVEYIQLSLDDVRKQIDIKDDEAQQYYEANKANFLTPAKWQVSHILISTPENATEAQRQKATEKADKLYKELKANPETFTAKVKTESDDKFSVAKNGMLPWIVAGQTELDKALVKLKKPNQISEPLQTSHGIEILKLMAYKPAVIKPYSDVKKEIKQQLLADKVQTKYAGVLEELSDLSYQSPDSLQPAADSTGLPIQKTELFTKNGGNTPLTKNKDVIKAAFSHDVLALDNNSDPVQIDNNSVIVLRIIKHIDAKEKPLAIVKGDIIDAIATDKAKVRAEQIGNEIVSANKNLAQQSALISKYKLTWKTVTSMSRDTDKVNANINELAFSIAKPNTLSGQVTKSGSFVIVKLRSIHDGKISQLDEERQASIKQQLETNYGIMDYDIYINGLMETAKIKDNNPQ
jgi:peptidyl-prolyl cis-trans isomerase D